MERQELVAPNGARVVLGSFPARTTAGLKEALEQTMKCEGPYVTKPLADYCARVAQKVA